MIVVFASPEVLHSRGITWLLLQRKQLVLPASELVSDFAFVSRKLVRVTGLYKSCALNGFL